MSSGWGTQLIGYNSAIQLLEGLKVSFDGDAAYLVGPSVEYAIYVDRGTSKMEARPFVEPAARRVQSNLDSALGEFLDGPVADAGEEAIVKSAALAVEKEMKQIITEKGAVDTGALRASVSIERVS